MRLPLVTREEQKDDPSVPASAIVGIILASLLVIVAIYALFRTLRLSHPNPKYLPTSFLKNRWRSWKPKSMKYRLFGFDPGPPTHRPNTSRSTLATEELRISNHEMSSTNADSHVNRNTSIRSIITLPAYNPAPSPNERLIAREGERGGVDTVVEYPETQEEEEVRREADMDALYQIRLARRRENEERGQRRQERHAAREAGDWARLEQLRLQARMRARARAGSVGTGSSAAGSEESLERTASALLAEHTSRASSHDRRVSSVSYADLGLARHDGSRLRADSVESDHRPLLGEAASMGGSRPGSRRSSLWNVSQPQLPPPLPFHQRAASMDGSFVSNDSEAYTPITSTHGEPSGSGNGSDPPVLTPHASSSSQEGGDAIVPVEEPPQYEDTTPAPPYTSPIRERSEEAPQLPAIEPVPSIAVEGATPASSVPPTPIGGHEAR